ncbi:MAG: glycosylase [Bacteroidota bacterium]
MTILNCNAVSRQYKQLQYVMLLLFVCLLPACSFGQALSRTVDSLVMQQVYNEVKTPFKYGLVIVPPGDSKKVDCPTVFKNGQKWYMSYIVFDGRGYETWLANSNDLLNWKTLGKLLSFSSDTTSWDAHQKAGYPSLLDPTWGGSYAWQQYQGKYWMSYFGGNTKGYEAGLLSIGIAHTKKPLLTPHEFERLNAPVLSATDKDTRWWENKKQFKSTIIQDKDLVTGHPFVMYYNANGDSAINNIKTRWFERIGMAVSDDMINWKRFEKEPVMHHPAGITGDAVLQKINNVWVMFYFGAFWEGRKDAFNRFACSYDLVHWTDWTGADLVNSTEMYDEKFAHKSFVVKHNGIVYHFYNAVNKKDQRGIAVATSVDAGKSNLYFN